MNERARVANGAREPYAEAVKDRGPIWISTVNYYSLVLFLTATVFFIVLAIMYDGYGGESWFIAAGSALTFAFSLFLFREVLLRRARARALAARRLSHLLAAAKRVRPGHDGENKLTLHRNDELLREIRVKSDAAKVLGKFAEGHREVFELCDAYLGLASVELARARVGSPRIPAIRKGAASAAKRHRYHMLKWAELKACSFTAELNNSGSLPDKMEAAEDALSAVERAFYIYPEEAALHGSRELLRVFLSTGRVRSLVESAERAAEAGEAEKALENYRSALAALDESGAPIAERGTIKERIKSEIDRLGSVAGDR